MEPHSLVGKTGEGGWSDWSLACGLQDQRLMARPPARAGGRSGLLTGGKTGTRTVTLCLFPKGTHPPPARPAGGRAVTDLQCEAAGRVSHKRYSLPHPIPPEKGVQREEPLPSGGFHFFPKKWGPGWASHRSLPFQRRGRKPATPPPPQNAASKLCLYEAVFSHCQTFSLQQDAAG